MAKLNYLHFPETHTLVSVPPNVGIDPPAKPSLDSACQNPTHFFKAHPKVSSSVWSAIITLVKNNIASLTLCLCLF